MPPRMTRKDVPAYFQWRKGRPRWQPGPSLRLRGFKGQDLKDPAGAWLSRGAAMELADRLNEATRDAPASELPRPAYTHTVNELIAEIRATRKFRLELDENQKGRKRRRIKKATRDAYIQHFGIIASFCGDLPVAGLRQKPLEDWYELLIEARGLSMANAIMRTFHMLLNFAKDTLEWVERNRIAQIELEQTEGRLVIWAPHEMAAFVAFADALELPEFGDGMVIGGMVGLRQSDLLGMPRLNLDGETAVLTSKTGRDARIPAVRHFKARILAARARHARAWPNVLHQTEIVCSKTGRRFTDKTDFRETFRLIRLYAAGFAHVLAAAGIGRWPAAVLALTPCPSLREKQWADLRDTSVTMLLRAGCTDAEIATIQGRSLQSIKNVIDKHYFVRDDGFARAGGNKLEAFLDASGVKW